MPHENPSRDELKRLLTQARTIAVVGASSNRERPSNSIMRKLMSVGYRVFPVNPNESTVLGQKAYRSLAEVPEPIDIVDVFRRSEATPPIADDAVAVGARTLWLQSGVVNEEAAARAKAGGLTVVMDECIAVVHSMLRVSSRDPGAPPSVH